MRIPARVPVLSFVLLVPLVGAATLNTARTTVSPDNTHSLGTAYQFDPRDGWTTFNATTFQEARQDRSSAKERRSKKNTQTDGKDGKAVSETSLSGTLKALGEFVSGVTCTWYACLPPLPFSPLIFCIGIQATICSILVAGQIQNGLRL